MGSTSSYYELALYKLGWTLYKQELYEEALHKYMAMLDHRNLIGYDFDDVLDENDEHRVADTFRVVSLSFSNLGGPEVVDEYFAAVTPTRSTVILVSSTSPSFATMTPRRSTSRSSL